MKKVKETKYYIKRRNKAIVSCIAFVSIAIYGIFFSDKEFAKALGLIASGFGLLQWILWSASQSLIDVLEKNKK